MSLPSGISVCTVTVGVGADFIGDDTTITVEVTPILGGNTVWLTWAATGQPIVPFTSTFSGPLGVGASFQVPHVDQAGFRDGSGNAFTMWSYSAKVTITVAATGNTPKQSLSKTKVFQVVVGQATVDLDMVPDGTLGVPGSTPVPAVTSVNGMTGAVVIGGGGGSGTVVSVNGKTPDGAGNVQLVATDVGADPSGAAATAQTNAQNFTLSKKVTDLTPPTTAVAWNSKRLTSVADPTNPQDAATKAYVDANIGGGGGVGTVISVNGHTPDGAGNVALAAGDVGADTSGAAATALTQAQTYTNSRKVTDLTAPTTAFSMNSQKITALAAPTVGTDAVNKTYADALVFSSGGGYPADWLDLDSFSGTDDQKMAAAIAAVTADTYKRTIKFRNRQYTFANTYTLNVNGLRFLGDVSIAREFRNVNDIKCPSGGLFAVGAQVAGKWPADFSIKGLTFTGTGSWMATTTNVLTDADITECGWQGFASVMNCKITRCNLSRHYVNGATGTQFTLGGSDSTLWVDGQSYISGSTMATGLPFIQFGSMSQTLVGNIYITPTNGMAFKSTAGDDAEGLLWNNFLATAFGQNGATKPQGAGIKLTGGTASTFLGGRLFNMNANKADKGWISCTGGIDHTFSDFTFVMTHEGFTSVDNDANTAAVYTTVPIRVINPKSSGGFPKRLRQASSGLIYCNDPSWTIVTSP